MSVDEPLPTIAYTAEFLKLLAMNDKAAYALRPVFAARIERMSTKGAWLPRAVVVGQEGMMYLIDPSSNGRVTHQVDFGLQRKKKITLDIEAKADKDGRQCVRLTSEKLKVKDPEVVLVRFHCGRGPLAMQFAFVVKHFARRPCQPELAISILGADKSLVEATKPTRSSSNPRSAVSALQKAASSRELVTLAEKEKVKLEKQKQEIIVPPPKAVPPPGSRSIVAGESARAEEAPALSLPEVMQDRDNEPEDPRSGSPVPLATSSHNQPVDDNTSSEMPPNGNQAPAAVVGNELRAAQELDLVEIGMQCDLLQVRLETAKQKLADEALATAQLEEEFRLQINARRESLRTAPAEVKVTVEGQHVEDDDDWEIDAIADVESAKSQLREATARRDELVARRKALEKSLEGVGLGALGANTTMGDARQETDEEVDILMTELRVAQDELADEQEDTLVQRLAAESEVESTFQKTILLQRDTLQRLQEQHHALRAEFMSPAAEAESIANARPIDDARPIARDPTQRPRTVRELKSRIQADLMRL